MIARALSSFALASALSLAVSVAFAAPPLSLDWQLKKNERNAFANFVTAVDALQPRAYFRLDAMKGDSRSPGSAHWEATGSVAIASPGALPDSRYAAFDGRNGAIRTTYVGGIHSRGTLMAWLRLDALPSNRQRAFFVVGEPQAGNDFDLRFDIDDTLRLRTGAATPLAWKPPADGLLHRWHLLVATLDTRRHTREIFWDGESVAYDDAGGTPDKTAPLAIGSSDATPGGTFEGGIEDVAIWDDTLKDGSVRALWKASQPPRAVDH